MVSDIVLVKTPQPARSVTVEDVNKPSLSVFGGVSIDIHVMIDDLIFIPNPSISLRSASEMRPWIIPGLIWT